MGYLQHRHDIVTGEVTEYGNNVGNEPPLFCTQFNKVPTLITTIEMNKYGRNKYSEKINQQEYLKLVIPGQKSHIAEGKQGY